MLCGPLLHMKIVGLTGGIATGKSTVSQVIRQEHVALIDCDEIAHAVVRKGRWGHSRVVKAFGSEVLQPDGELDRAALGSKIFSDPAARKRLNAATHLPVFLEILRQIVVFWLRFRAVVVVDMPLLFETGSHRYASTNILVTCEPETQVERLMKRDSCTKEQAAAKVGSQMPMEQKLKLCDIVIDNNGSREETRRQTLEALRQVRRHSWIHRILLGPGLVVALVAGTCRLAWRRG